MSVHNNMLLGMLGRYLVFMVTLLVTEEWC